LLTELILPPPQYPPPFVSLPLQGALVIVVVHTFVFQPIVNRKVFCVFVAGGAVATAAEAANAAAVGRPAAATTTAGRMVHRTQTSAKSKRSSRSGNPSSSHTVVEFLSKQGTSVIKKFLKLHFLSFKSKKIA